MGCQIIPLYPCKNDTWALSPATLDLDQLFLANDKLFLGQDKLFLGDDKPFWAQDTSFWEPGHMFLAARVILPPRLAVPPGPAGALPPG